MADIPPILIQIQTDVADLKKGLAEATGQLKGLDNNVKQSASGMTKFADKVKQVGATLGVAFAGSQVLQFFKDSVTQAREAAAAQDRLATLLRNTNGASEEQIAALHAQADALEAVGVVSADNITITQSQLATFDLTGQTIKTLTPAILDYVTAEKGAAASADEFKSMTNSLAQALNGNFASLTKVGFVLDEATKKQIASGTETERAAALVKVLNSTYEGFNERLRETQPLQAALNDLQKLQGDIGKALLPILENIARFVSDKVVPALRSMAKFVKDNATEIKTLAGILAAGYAALKLYRGLLILTATAKTVFAVATTLMRRQQLATIASTNGLAASMLALNAAMRANPIGIIVTALALVGAAFVAAWKRSETFRSVVIAVAKAALTAFASVIPMIARVGEAILKVITGPFRSFLAALSKLPGVGSYAKSALDMINKGLDGISDMGQKAADKARELSSKLDGLAKITKKANDTGKDLKGVFDGLGKGAQKSAADIKKLADEIAKLKKEGQDIIGDMNKVVAKGEERKAEAAKRRDKDIAAAQKRAAEAIEKAEKKAAKDRAKAQQAYDDEVLRAQETRDKAEIAARKRNTETLIKIAQDYAKRVQDITNTKNQAIAKAEEKANDARVKAEEAAANKRLSIIQQSIDRLRSAFAAKTGFDLAESFKSGGSVERLLTDLKDKLAGAQELQANAAALAGRGYSQTFIEEVVKQGPEIGNQLAKSLLEATPQATAELQALYSAVETVSETGLDSLAKQMNSGANLATRELREAYAQVAVDLSESLAEINKNLTDELAEANKAYEASIVEAKNLRDAGLADAAKELQEALDEAASAYAENVKDAQRTLTRALAEINAELAETLEEINKELLDAIAEANATYNEAIQEITDETTKALNELATKLAEVAAALRKLGDDIAANNLLRSAPSATIVPTTITARDGVAGWRAGEETTYANYITQNFTAVSASPYEVSNATINALRYGQAVTVGTSMRAMGRD